MNVYILVTPFRKWCLAVQTVKAGTCHLHLQ